MLTWLSFPDHLSHPVITYCDCYGNTDGNFVNVTDPTGSSGKPLG